LQQLNTAGVSISQKSASSTSAATSIQIREKIAFFYSAILQRFRFYFEKPRFLHYFRTETNFEAKNEDCISWKAKIED
jgi:hypothetical protein